MNTNTSLKYREYGSVVKAPPSDISLMLRFSRAGINLSSTFENPTDEELVANLNKGLCLIYVPWFWHHERVTQFVEKYLKILDLNAVIHSMNLCRKEMDGYEPHDIELINYFHLWGFIRLLATSHNVNQVPTNTATGHDRIGEGFVDLSMQNALLIQGGISPESAIDHARSMFTSKPWLARAWSEYQLYYYGGYFKTLQALDSSLGTPKEVFVPSQIVGLSLAFEINDQIFSDLESFPKLYRQFDLYALRSGSLG